MFVNSRLTQLSDKFSSRSKGNYFSNGGCAGLKLIGNVVIGCFFEMYIADHGTTTLIGRQRLQLAAFAIKNAHPGRSVNLMRGENQKVAANLLHVNRKMSYRLRGVNQYPGARLMSKICDLPDGINGAQGIGDMYH